MTDAIKTSEVKRNITALDVEVVPPDDLSWYAWLELRLNGGEPVVMASPTVQVFIQALARAIGARATLEFERPKED